MSILRPPFDPEIAAAMLDQAETVVISLAPDEIDGLRASSTAPDIGDVAADAGSVASVHHAPGPAGDVRLLLVRPIDASGPVPVLLHLHGGGLITGEVSHNVDMALDVAPGWAVASVEYRLAPENPYPAAVEDAYAALTWLVANAAELGLDAERVVVSGVSAGGGLAAALALLARDRGGPDLLGQLLIYPMLDDRNETVSSHQIDGFGVWDRGSNDTGWDALLGERRKTDDVSIYAAPARATDLTGLPPAFIDVASAEVFRDEDVAYATKIWEQGGVAELHVWPGGFHGFDAMAPQAALSVKARAARLDWLHRILGA